MAKMRRERSGEHVTVRQRALIGRSSCAHVHLSGEASSGEHALIHWDGRDWILRDLSSRNGTRINGTLLINREWRLAVGDRFIFGDPIEEWSWVDSSPPTAKAIGDGVTIESVGGLLLLPDPETPIASVYPASDHWELESSGVVRRIDDDEVIELGGRRFRLQLPSLHPMGHRTRTFTDDRTVSTARARFSVSWNEEHVGLVLETHSGHVELPSRAFSYLLLQLGRALDADLRGGIPAGEAGWMYAEDLAAKLHSTVEKINVDVHRARQALAATGMFGDPEAFIERRRGSGQMRIRVGEIVLFREPSSPAVGHGA